MRIDLLTREYPPEVYGGAGVHVAELVRALRERRHDVRVRALAQPVDESGTFGYRTPEPLENANPAVRHLGAGLAAASDAAGADVVHSHTWYTNLAGHIAGLLHDVPHVMTLHSLEPRRPWKAEQLGTGYALSSWMEREAIAAATAVIAVSDAMRRDILESYPEVDADRVHVIHNGIDTERYRPDHGSGALERYGIDPTRPIVLFVGRVARQKGVCHLLEAGFRLRGEAQLVLCCGQADTPELGAETDALIAELSSARTGVVRIREMLDRECLLQLLTRATVFVCPSLYEPMGIVNLEAMAAQTAVVATEVGGIPEVVEDGRTGLLVPYKARDATGAPERPECLADDLAEAVNTLLDDPDRAAGMGLAGRLRAERHFSWRTVAERTAEVYSLARSASAA